MDHVASYPSWDCQACGRQWPCDPAREALKSEPDMTRTPLAMLMAAHLTTAAADMPTAPPDELWERFLAWTR